VWQAEEQVGDAFKTIEWLEEQGKKVYFITNNATKSPSDIGEKMKRMGYNGVKLDHIYTSASIIAPYVKLTYPQVRKVFVVGMKSLRNSM
jgi:4-nitrophenyl phosphatase